MSKISYFFCIIFLLSACQQTKKGEVNAKEKGEESDFELYEMSEMAVLMEDMYTHHEKQKALLVKGEAPGAFPEDLLRIHTATFTDPADNDSLFKSWARLYIQYEKNSYTDAANAVTHYNNAVNVCIMCHQQKCTGPIPRIKKLLIAE